MTIHLNAHQLKQFAVHAFLACALSAIITLILYSNPDLLRFAFQVFSLNFRR